MLKNPDSALFPLLHFFCARITQPPKTQKHPELDDAIAVEAVEGRPQVYRTGLKVQELMLPRWENYTAILGKLGFLFSLPLVETNCQDMN